MWAHTHTHPPNTTPETHTHTPTHTHTHTHTHPHTPTPTHRLGISHSLKGPSLNYFRGAQEKQINVPWRSNRELILGIRPPEGHPAILYNNKQTISNSLRMRK